MKKIAIIASLFCLAVLSSCELKDELTGTKGGKQEMGALELSVSVPQEITESRANTEAPGNYPVVVMNKETEEEAYNGTYEAMEKPLRLPVGTYIVSSHTPGDIETTMLSPYYGGEKEMTISKEITSVLDVVCKMLNTKITLNLGDNFKSAFTEWTITLNDRNSHVLTFTQANENSTIYWYLGADSHVATLTMDITATTTDGVKVRDQKQFTKADASENYENDNPNFTGGDVLNINIGAIEESDPEPGQKPQLGFNVSVDITFDGRDETVEIPVVDVPTTNPPGDEKLPTIEKQDVTYSITAGDAPADAVIKINAPAGLKSMNVKIVAGNEGFGKAIGDMVESGLDFVESGVEMVENEAVVSLFEELQMSIEVPKSNVTSYDFPLSTFFFLMNLYNETAPKAHVFQVVVEDMNGNKVSDEVSVTINK